MDLKSADDESFKCIYCWGSGNVWSFEVKENVYGHRYAIKVTRDCPVCKPKKEEECK